VPKSYTILQAANKLNVSRRTIYNYIASGKLLTNRTGVTQRVTAESLEQLLHEHEHQRHDTL
jgi:excisionase family DNA binding protein